MGQIVQRELGLRELPTLPLVQRLTKRQRQVLMCAANGLDYHEGARFLHISYFTYKSHVAAILWRLQAENMTNAVYKAMFDLNRRAMPGRITE